MSLNKLNTQLNKNVNEETAYINALPLLKYFLIYVPVLFLLFATVQFIASLLFDYQFRWRSVLIQASLFAVFFRVFHYFRKLINDTWKK
jgi:hypothetical protein